MIKVYELSRKYIMLFRHNNRYLPSTGLLTVHPRSEIFEIFQKYFMRYFTPKNFMMKFNVTRQDYAGCTQFYARAHIAINQLART